MENQENSQTGYKYTNAKIVKFMGGSVEFLNELEGDWVYLERGNCYLYETKYHISWDWLMPVVERVEQLFNEKLQLNEYFWESKEVTTRRNNFLTYRVPQISDLHTQVVEFITWYNNQNK